MRSSLMGLRLLICVFVLLSFETCRGPSDKVTVAVAANMRLAIEEVAQSFEDSHDLQLEIASGSSGVLATQVMQGAPFDVFLSANVEYPRQLYEKGFTTQEPMIFASGHLILWSLDHSLDLTEGLSVLADTAIRKIALANPEIAPYGIAAIQVLENAGLPDEVNEKLVFAESVAQVNQYVASGVVQVGLTSKSALDYKGGDESKHLVIHESLYPPIYHGVVILKRGDDENSQRFYDYLFTDEVRDILLKFGYDVP